MAASAASAWTLKPETAHSGMEMLMRPQLLSLCSTLITAACLLTSPVAAVVTIDWVTVGDAGNACETQTQGC
jgi:hypothetical protein